MRETFSSSIELSFESSRPKRRRHLQTAFVVVLSSFGWAPGSARAQDTTEPIQLEYEASGGCPPEAEFIARLRARTTRARPAWPGEAARRFVVTLDPGPPAHGRVTIRSAQGAEASRSVQGDSCSDAADAIALMVALAVDPRASEPAPLPVAPPPAPPAAPVSAPPLPPSIPPPAPALPVSIAPVAPVARAEDASARAATSVPLTGPSFVVGADVAIATGVAPNVLVGASLYLGWSANRAGWFDPSLWLSLVHAQDDAFAVPNGGTATFTWTVGHLDACPVTWEAIVRTRACVRIEAGVLDASGGDVPAAQSKSLAWFAAGPLVRAEWSLWHPLVLDLEGGALFRAPGERFVFLPNVPIYQVPIAGVTAEGGIGIDFL